MASLFALLKYSRLLVINNVYLYWSMIWLSISSWKGIETGRFLLT